MLHFDTFHYVSLLDNLKMLLDNDEVYKNMFYGNNKCHIPGVYSDFADGTFVQSLSVDSNWLQIIGYYDELETTNPLGSNTKKYKLGFVFYTLGNLHPKFRSTHTSIYLSTVANYTIVETHGISKVLQPFVDELNQLAQVGIISHGRVHKGGLIAFLGDNLASHTVGGYKQSMSFATHFLRSCMATKEESIQHFVAEEFEKRTPEQYEEMCAKIAADSTGRLSVEYGINERSILNDVAGFSVVGGLCHDAFHDLLEGAVNYELRLLLEHVFTCGYISLNQLNDRLKSFNCGYTETDSKPNQLTTRCFKEGKIRYSASEMLLMTRILPFLIGDKVPEDDEHYVCLLKLIVILQIALCPSPSDDVISYLRVLIEEHHTMFIELYPNHSFIPKFHYLIHYPDQIRMFGPLIRAWTMRYEGKLNYFKQIARSGNYKNITLTLAKRHQRWLSYQLHSGNIFTLAIYSNSVLHTLI